MTSDKRRAEYHLGNTDAEHERLIRQAARLAPVTERVFREAGMTAGQRVLDLGAGVGDVAMIAARIVGPSGDVVAIELDARTIDRARRRAVEAGVHNIDFVQMDIDKYSGDASFDAVVGRYILQFLPDPVATLRSVRRQLRPGGIVAFQEGSWAPFLQLSSHLPLWSAAVALLDATGARAGVNLEMGPGLHRAFLEAGLPAPRMRLEMELGCDPDLTRWLSDALRSVLPRIEEMGIDREALGDFDTLQGRLQNEVTNSNTVVPWIGLVAAWVPRPAE
jgi:ubiquinone/menaquinone biosynthesis C-methylase UbiE